MLSKILTFLTGSEGFAQLRAWQHHHSRCHHQRGWSHSHPWPTWLWLWRWRPAACCHINSNPWQHPQQRQPHLQSQLQRRRHVGRPWRERLLWAIALQLRNWCLVCFWIWSYWYSAANHSSAAAVLAGRLARWEHVTAPWFPKWSNTSRMSIKIPDAAFVSKELKPQTVQSVPHQSNSCFGERSFI